VISRCQALVCALGLISCAGAPAPQAPYPHVAVPFHLSSLMTDFMVRGDFWGVTEQTATMVTVRVDSTTIRRPPARFVALPTVWVRATLAMRTHGDSWRILARSKPMAILDSTPGGTSVTPPLGFAIAKPRGFDPAKYFLVFEFAFDLPTKERTYGPSTTYTCGYPGMLLDPPVVDDPSRLGACGVRPGPP